MATAIGTYATLAAAKSRLGLTGTADDAVLQTLCDQVNAWIESFTGRILAPIPAVSTTLAAAASSGATSITLTSTAGLARGDAIMFGPVSGTHEHGVVSDIAGSLVTLQAALANNYALGASVVRVQLFDGFGALEGGRLLPITNGIVTATSVEVALYTGGPFSLIPATDWYIRPTPLEREPGWPGTELWMTNIPSAGNTTPYFPPGFANVRVAGSFGWPAILDEITSVALSAVVSAYRLRSAGGGDSLTIGVDGSRTFERVLGYEEKRTLMRYVDKRLDVI